MSPSVQTNLFDSLSLFSEDFLFNLILIIPVGILVCATIAIAYMLMDNFRKVAFDDGKGGSWINLGDRSLFIPNNSQSSNVNYLLNPTHTDKVTHFIAGASWDKSASQNAYDKRKEFDFLVGNVNIKGAYTVSNSAKNYTPLK